jgi:hypothetical protein
LQGCRLPRGVSSPIRRMVPLGHRSQEVRFEEARSQDKARSKSLPIIVDIAPSRTTNDRTDLVFADFKNHSNTLLVPPIPNK